MAGHSPVHSVRDCRPTHAWGRGAGGTAGVSACQSCERVTMGGGKRVQAGRQAGVSQSHFFNHLIRHALAPPLPILNQLLWRGQRHAAESRVCTRQHRPLGGLQAAESRRVGSSRRKCRQAARRADGQRTGRQADGVRADGQAGRQTGLGLSHRQGGKGPLPSTTQAWRSSGTAELTRRVLPACNHPPLSDTLTLITPHSKTGRHSPVSS